jgi:hypothetical protein
MGSARLRIPIAAGGEVVDQVQGVAHGPSEPVEGVNHDDVAVAGVLDHSLQAGAVGGGAGLLVDVDPLGRDPGRLERDDLPIEVLFGRRNPRVPEIHPRTVPKVKTVRMIRDGVSGLTSGTRLPGCP